MEYVSRAGPLESQNDSFWSDLNLRNGSQVSHSALNQQGRYPITSKAHVFAMGERFAQSSRGLVLVGVCVMFGVLDS